ncbi:hypothetical protein AN217_16660 [Streptomyces qinglanensis]|uniref:Uncharacterized protein n=1 Tax=Streptomyces qinglanensis TaxID=943816 RepID=A0A1E7K5G4_9ACTN|nr:hypothetical protein [Streptomyces qinglanensis]OEU99170.1 hypothetical protein AN217_16660 [Streptomyces qinglanensis]OEV25168.1 hypothetical protein AN220_15210 [Streptomyces nanshensis]OEV25169.1 hypothetical protein AN220_15220 [Streptomyces nanshensis]
MFRRSVLALATVLATTVLAVAPAAAAAEAPVPQTDELSPREQAALGVAEKALGTLLGGVVSLGGN